MTAHPNRNWRRRWAISADRARVTHETGLVVEIVRHPDGSADVQTVDGTLPLPAPGMTPADHYAHRDHLRTLLDQAVTLLTAPRLP